VETSGVSDAPLDGVRNGALMLDVVDLPGVNSCVEEATCVRDKPNTM
jgi:hypothetical protein